jgi:DNA-binding SARP family transcriptional activator
MPPVSVRLFGSFSITDQSGLAAKFPPGKLQDLFCYLLINRDRELQRELIASIFWGNTTTSQSKKYLRTALWQLRTLLEASFGAAEALHVDAFFVRLDPGSHFWLDIAEFERINKSLVKIPAVHPNGETVTRMKAAAALYSGELLPGNYCDWCLRERGRYQEMYLALLDKLLAHCEIQYDYDDVRHYGSLLLRYDPLSERTYQRLMRLYYLVGDRGEALAVYEKCASTLRKYLRVEPSDVTIELCRQIRSGALRSASVPGSPAEVQTSADDIFSHLRLVESMMVRLEKQVRSDLRALSQTSGLQRVTVNPGKKSD